MALNEVNTSFNIQIAKTEISIGVVNISKDACIVEVSVSPLTKSVWLIAMPVNAQSKKRGKSFFSIFADVLLNIHTNQNKMRLLPTRSTFNANGFTNTGDINFTKL